MRTARARWPGPSRRNFAAAIGSLVALWASGCGDEEEYVLVSGAGPDVARDTWLDSAELVQGDGASEFISELPPTFDYRQPRTPQIETGVEVRGLPRAVVDGSRVYSLSLQAGLVITDVSDPLAPRVLARQPINGEPVGLVARDGRAHVLVNDPSFLNTSPTQEFSCSSGDINCDAPRSRLLSFDVRQPESVRALSEHAMRGAATNARLVGDALYVASQSFEDCFECLADVTALEPRSLLSSFDLSDPAAGAAPVAELSFDGLAHRTFSFGAEHLYLVEQLWPPPGGTGGPELRVFDLSSTGSLIPGPTASFGADAHLDDLGQSRRVVEAGEALYVLTSDDGVPHSAFTRMPGSALEQMPVPELADEGGAPLVVWKIDGTRMFGLTSADTLVAFDLGDPSAPLRRGSLQLPAVDSITLSGDYVLAWGVDAETSNLALVDVSNPAQPLLVDAASGASGPWIVDDSMGLFVSNDAVYPDAGYRAVPVRPGDCGGPRGAFARLVFDPRARDLSARVYVEARAGVLAIGERYLAAGSFSFTSTPFGGPSSGAVHAVITRPIVNVQALGDRVAAFGVDAFTLTATLDIGSSSALASLTGASDVAALLGLPSNGCEEMRSWGNRVFEFGAHAYVTRFHRAVDASGAMTNDVVPTLYGIDRSDPDALTPSASVTLRPLAADEQYAGVLSTERTLIIVRKAGDNSRGSHPYAATSSAASVDERVSLDIVDLSEPTAPRLATSFEVPAELAAGDGLDFSGEARIDARWGWSTGPLFTSGSLVFGQHAELRPDGRVVYYLDRLDVSDPSAPALLEPINVPGRVLQLDAETGSLVTLDTLKFEEHAEFGADCAARGLVGAMSIDLSRRKQECRLVRRVLNGLRIEGDVAVRQSQLILDAGRRAMLFAVSADQLFYVTEPPLERNAAPFAGDDALVSLERISVRGGRLERLPSLDLSGQHRYLPRHWQAAVARRERFYSASAGALSMVDFQADPPALSRYMLPAPGCAALEVAGENAFCALGRYGFASIELGTR